MIHKFNSILARGSSGRLAVWWLSACLPERIPQLATLILISPSSSSLLVHALVVPKTVANTTDPTSKHPTGNTGKRHSTFICGSAVAARQQCSLCCCCCCCSWPPVNALVINYVWLYVCLDLCVCVFCVGCTARQEKQEKTKAKCCNAIVKLINKTHMFCVKWNN